jgi:cyanophycinase-like exopeptidase
MRGAVVAPGAQLVGIGAALTQHSTALLSDLRALEREITVVAAAAAAGPQVAKEYVKLLQKAGIAARAFDRRRDSALEDLAQSPALLFTGGNQERLVQALFHLGEESPLLLACLAAYLRGGTLIAVGGSANALSPTMLSGGNAEEASCSEPRPIPGIAGWCCRRVWACSATA